jgi:hypothetical protein
MVRRLILLGAVAVAIGCSDNRTTIEIRGHAFPSDTSSGCKFSATGQLQLGPGLLDVAYPLGYGAAGGPTYGAVLYVTNTSADPTKSGTTPGSTISGNSWRALAARIRLNPSDYTSDFPPNPPLLPIALESRVALDGQTTRPGDATTQFVTLLEPTVATLVQSAMPAGAPRSLVVGVTLEGETLGGQKVDSGEWFFSIQVCRGCAATACSDPSKVLSSCFGGWQDPTFCK